MSQVQSMRFVARSGLPTGWNGRGAGAVVVERPTAEIIIFHESGVWQPQGDGEVDFSNIFRWSKVEPQTIRLEHLRYGPEQPVYLFDLAAGSDGEWHSVRPHLCRADVYAARLWYDERFIFMAWTITGPKKQETIEYAYSW